MAKPRSAGDLFHRVAFDKREEIDRGDGVFVGQWVEQFQVRAGFAHLRGGESVMADRLQGQHTQVIFVRSSSQTRAVDTDWRVRDVRRGEFVNGEWVGSEFNIRDVTPTNDRQWLDFLCQSGVASG
ncbi:head-tail adaptor protein [Rhizobium pusense]|uniref:Head-tail adaptor protein n=1 Tax=Agrobacterium pusense TaxID=648995 RepID=A0A6H0ZTY9_9HYPH|nr:head-tail adaptor protein [Agrobacterium pusense]MDH2092101.1 head-tail adaptor protein [Agrobacterium pusense]QIX23693.1 head-tail adaptor protein [Agrobacterium pusense]WCK24153.1 head-tail adaptor protein [Agrobacterium pusense]